MSVTRISKESLESNQVKYLHDSISYVATTSTRIDSRGGPKENRIVRLQISVHNWIIGPLLPPSNRYLFTVRIHLNYRCNNYYETNLSLPR